MERKTEDRGEHRNIARTMAILDSLAKASAQGLRLADIIRATGLGKTTAHRILTGLAAQGLVEQDDETGRFFIGLKMLSWASAAKNRFSFVRLAEPALDRICRRTHDTIYLVTRVGDEAVCLDAREGSFPIKVLTLNIGDRRPLGIGSGSLALLAFLPDAEVERIMTTQATMRAPFPFDDIQLRHMIAATRQNGYSYTNTHVFPGMENLTDMAGMAVPIRRSDGMPVAALHLTAITPRIAPPRRENLFATLRKEADQIEAELGPVLDTMQTSSVARKTQPVI